MGIDISPDGKSLVFDMLGDIYVLPVKGGQATRLTSGSGWDARPTWSPDGARVAFISDRSGDDQVFVVNATDGSGLAQVTFKSQKLGMTGRTIEGDIKSAEWMPDGAHILISGWRFPVDFNDPAHPPQPVEFNSNVYYGSGGRLFYFTPSPNEDVASIQGIKRKESYEAWKLANGSSPIRLASLDGEYELGWESPAVSPDGRWIVYPDRSPLVEAPAIHGYLPAPEETDADTIRVFDSKHSVERVLVGPGMSPGWRSNGVNKGAIGFSSNIRYAISPDSRDLFLSYGGSIHRIDLKSGRDERLDMIVTVDQCMEPMAHESFPVDDGDLTVRNMRYITRSDKDGRLLFSALRRLYVLDSGSSTPRRFYAQHEGQFEPSYSPDGKWIAYVTWDDTVGGHLWRIRADGTSPEKLTTRPGYYVSPTWSPDGRTIAYAGNSDLSVERKGFEAEVYGGHINLISIADRRVFTLRPEVRLGTQLSFAQDGKLIYFRPHEEGSGGPMTLSSIAIDGAEEQHYQVDRLFKNYGSSSASVHPSGSTIAAVKYGNIYLLTCPVEITDFASDRCWEIKVTREGGNDPQWRENGTVLEWSFASTYYRAFLSDLIGLSGPSSDGKVAVDKLADAGKLVKVHIDLRVPRQSSAGTIALTGGRIITMRGNEIIDSGTLLIRDGRIAAVGATADVRIPDGATAIDVAGKVLMPGLIDSHAHFNNYPRDLLAANHWEPLVSLAYGITSLKNPSNGGDHAFAYAELVETGDMVGPRMYGTPGLVGVRVGEIKSLQDAVNIVSRSRQLGAKLVKYHTGFNRPGRRWIIEAARMSGLNVAAHLPVAQYILGRLNLSTIFDGTTSTEHEISDQSDLYDDVRQYLNQSGVGVCFAPMAGYGGYPARYWSEIASDSRMKRFFRGDQPANSMMGTEILSDGPLAPLRPDAEANAKLIAVLAHGGQHIMIGSHGDYDGIGMHLEMWAHVHGGMLPLEVLRAATLNGAWSLGIDADLGSIEVGKIADVLVLDRNPIEDIRNSLSIDLVIKGGTVRKAGTLEEVWPKAQPLPDWELEGISHDRGQTSTEIDVH